MTGRVLFGVSLVEELVSIERKTERSPFTPGSLRAEVLGDEEGLYPAPARPRVAAPSGA